MTGVADEADVEPPDENVLAVDPTGRYICYKESVGEGAFKTVYKAFDEIDGIEVAWSQIKVTGALSSPAAVEMLRSELRLLKSLRHNNIIKYYKSWEDESNRTVHIITELFSSGSLRQYCLKHKKVDMRALKGWARQILSGLEYLHSQNPPIIHRDIKCDNIFINGNHGEVKIGDLGLATVLHQPSCQTMIGTPEFMAPEYYEEEYNELVDIYSFGMCMLEMVTLEYPYSECDSALQIIKKVISGKKPAVLSKVADPELKAFIEKCITNVSERPSASELLRGTFLQTDGANRSKPGLALLSADAVAKKSLPVKIPAKPEQPVKSSKMESRPDLNVDDEKLIVNTLIQSYADGRVLSVTCKVSKTKKDKKFLLTAQREGEGEGLVEFDLQIATGSAKGRQIDFTFYVDSDTASLIASELVEQDEIGTEDAKLITEMMESLLINLSQAWNASVTSNQLTVFDNNKACGPESEGAQSAAYETNSPLSSQITWEALDIPKPAIIGPSSIDVPLQHMPEPSETGSHDVISCSFPGPSIRSTDDLSDPSLMSICSFDENDKKLSLAFMCSPEEGLYSLHHFESETKTERVCDENGAGANEVAHSLDATCSTVEKFNNGDDDDDEKLRLELEIIELLYQQMISDIYQKKNEALVRARIGAASKNPLAPLRVMSRCSDCS